MTRKMAKIQKQKQLGELQENAKNANNLEMSMISGNVVFESPDGHSKNPIGRQKTTGTKIPGLKGANILQSSLQRSPTNKDADNF